MICPKCRGEGSYFYNGIWYPCERCNDTGEVKTITNEEWFCTLSTEEKAEVIAEKIRHAQLQYVPTYGTFTNNDWWKKWLKEIHK